MKKIAPDYYDDRPCHYSWIKVLIDFVRKPEMGPKSRIRRTIRSDALKSKNGIDLNNKSKVNEVLHEVVDANNNHHSHQPHLSKEERKLLYKKKDSTKPNDLSSSATASRGLTNGEHSKNE